MKYYSIITTLLLACIIISKQIHAQKDSLEISFRLLYGQEQINLSDSSFKSLDSNEFTIDVFKFYISNIELSHKGELIFKEPNSYHLIDAAHPESLDFFILNVPNIQFDSLSFLVGIDSLTNVSGAIGGDLDPTKGMYWTWQSGYINFKLEGTSNDVRPVKTNTISTWEDISSHFLVINLLPYKLRIILKLNWLLT